MANLKLKLVGYPWDHIMPLVTKAVAPEGIDLSFDLTSGLAALYADPSIDGGESSVGHYMVGQSEDRYDLVGLPIFPMFAFRHRCYLVKRGTAISSLAELEGKRVGMDGWPNSGNTWSRVNLRQAGVDIGKIAWTIAPIEGPGHPSPTNVPPLGFPPNVKQGPAGKSLVDLLLAGELDAIIAAFMPAGFFEKDSPIVHMFPDYPAHERAYFEQHGYIPGHHLLTIKRPVIEANPWIARSLMAAYNESKRFWVENRRRYADTTPWLLADLKQTADVFGEDWQPYGLEPNLKMLTDFCQDQFAQGVVRRAVDPVAAFADYTRFVSETA